MQTEKEQEELKKAYEDGKLLERSDDNGNTWHNCARVGFKYPLKFDFETFIYRIKEDSDRILALEKDLAIVKSEIRDKSKELKEIENIRDSLQAEIHSLKAQRAYEEFKGDWAVECLQDKWISISVENFIEDVTSGGITHDDGSGEGLCIDKSTGKLYTCGIDLDDFMLPDKHYDTEYERDEAIEEHAESIMKKYSSKNGFYLFGILWFNK